MNNARTFKEALAEIEGVSLDVHRAEATEKKKLRERGVQLCGLPPSDWPSINFNWDLSRASQHYIYDGLNPSDFAKSHPDGFRLGYVGVCEFDLKLSKNNYRADLTELWGVGVKEKLCYVLAHLEAGLPITPPLVLVTNGEFHLVGGNHRYTAAKFSGQKCIPIYVEHGMESTVENLVQVRWVVAST